MDAVRLARALHQIVVTKFDLCLIFKIFERKMLEISIYV